MRHSLIDELAIRWWGEAPRAFEFQWHVRRLNNAVLAFALSRGARHCRAVGSIARLACLPAASRFPMLGVFHRRLACTPIESNDVRR